jgi:hypothetical protein
MKITRFCPLNCRTDDSGNVSFAFPFMLGRGPSAKPINLDMPLVPGQFEAQKREPVLLNRDQNVLARYGAGVLYHDFLFNVEDYTQAPESELLLRVKHFALKREREFSKIVREVEAFEQVTEAEGARRERIPDAIKLFVWQRDQGKCASCGSKEKLEFDHIIPVVEGGSTTERNIQVLCEHCNRSKGRRII